MRYKGELGVLELPNVLGEGVDVGLIQGGFDLVEYAERRGLGLQNGEHQRQSGESALAARKQGDVLEPLSGRLGFYLYGGFERMLGVAHGKRGMTALEELLEYFLEIDDDRIEAFPEPAADYAVHLAYDAAKLVHRGLSVVSLSCKEIVALLYLAVFFDGADVDVAESSQAVLELTGLPQSLSHDEVGILEGGRFRVGQLVVFPELFLQGLGLGIETRGAYVGVVFSYLLFVNILVKKGFFVFRIVGIRLEFLAKSGLVLYLSLQSLLFFFGFREDILRTARELADLPEGQLNAAKLSLLSALIFSKLRQGLPGQAGKVFRVLGGEPCFVFREPCCSLSSSCRRELGRDAFVFLCERGYTLFFSGKQLFG